MDEISSDEEDLIKSSFEELKPVCDDLMRNCTSENCAKFSTAMKQTPNVIFSYLFEYSVFPLHFHLCKYISGRELSSTVLIDLLRCLKKVLSKTPMNTVSKFIEYSILLLKIVLDFEKQELVDNVSEDVRFCVTNCLLTLYSNVDEKILHEIYDPSKRSNCHPQAVFFCTQVARREKYLTLRTSALKCLLEIAKVGGEEYQSILDEKLKYHVIETITPMFPGIISTCHAIIISDRIAHHIVHFLAVRVFGRIVTLIFENNSKEEFNEIDFAARISSLTTKIDFKPNNESTLNTRRDDKWYNEANEKLAMCTKGMVPICSSFPPAVRLEFVKFVNLVLTKCSKNIEGFSMSLVEILIILSHDCMLDVSTMARTTIKNLLGQDTQRSQQILEFIEENLCSLFDSIISSLNSADEKIFLSHLNLLNGYLNVLNLQRVFQSSFHLQRLVSTLIKTVRFDSSSLNSFAVVRIQELGLTDNENNNIQNMSWKNFKYLNGQSEKIVKDICQSIRQKVAVENMTFYLLDLFENNIEDRKEVIYLINNLILSSEAPYTEEYFNIMRTILNTYLDPLYWSVPISSTGDDFFNSFPSSLIHSNILQVCLLTEGIGMIAEKLRKKFKPLLLLCLYSIIENAGNPNEFISSAALETIKKITSSCRYSTITALISNNVDYVTHHVTLKLRKLHQNGKVFDVLDVIILHSEKKSLSVLCDIIETLLRSDNIMSDKFRGGFLKVFRSFVRKLRKWFAPLFNEDMSALNESDDRHFKFLIALDEYVNRNKPQSILTGGMKNEEVDLADIFKTTDFDFSEFDDENEENTEEITAENFQKENISEDNEEETEKPISQHIQLIVSVANRLVHVLPTKCVMDKILILEILMDSLLILNESENQLLPVVHKIWSPLVNRFKYDYNDALVLRRCFELLCIMAVTARDFIRNRTLKEVLPILNDFLSNASSESKLKDKKSVYRMSQKYKLQRTLLRELGYLSVYICLQEKELDSVLNAASSYLGYKQPKPLQKACCNLFKVIANYHYEFVWIHLLSIYPQQTVFTPPNISEFLTIKIDSNEGCEEFSKNIAILFGSLK